MSHDSDFYTWTQEQVALLTQGRWHELDIANLIEEIADMGRSERRELENRLTLLIAHMLKWQYQPQRRGNSWRLTIKGQRFQVEKCLRENPGLKSHLDTICVDAYYAARIQAAQETRLDESVFPINCPWTLAQISVNDFWPE